jgi:hypothetical protein
VASAILAARAPWHLRRGTAPSRGQGRPRGSCAAGRDTGNAPGASSRVVASVSPVERQTTRGRTASVLVRAFSTHAPLGDAGAGGHALGTAEPRPYLCGERVSSVSSWSWAAGGAFGGLGCCGARGRPSRVSVHDRAVRRAGEVMVDGVIPLGEALRPLGRWRPSTRAWRRDDAGSRPRYIGLGEGCARRPRGRAGCSAWSPSSCRVWWLRLSSLRAAARRARLPPSLSAAWR